MIWPQARDWSGAAGISLWLHSDAPGQPVNVVLYAGNPEAPTPFVARIETTDQAVSGWMEAALPWASLERADWADAGGLSSLDPAQIVGVGISIGSGKGALWLDDVTLLSGEAQPREDAAATATLAPTTAAASEQATATPAPEAVDAIATPEPVEAAAPEAPKKSLCRSAMGLPLLALLAAWLLRRQ